MKNSLGPGSILIIEDNKNIASLVAKYLTNGTQIQYEVTGRQTFLVNRHGNRTTYTRR